MPFPRFSIGTTMEVFEMPVMARISPATADRFALFVEALGAEAVELHNEVGAPEAVGRRPFDAAEDADPAQEVHTLCL